jgi:hypothetical protein
LEKIALIYPPMYAYLPGELTGLGGKWANIALGLMEASRIAGKMSQRARNYALWLFAVIGLEQEALAIFKASWQRSGGLVTG